MKSPRAVIRWPIVSEKNTILRDRENKYAFRVDKSANKIEIKKAVEEVFNVRVVGVNTMTVHGKTRRVTTRRGRSEGKRPDWKKAVVTLAEGDSIQLYEGV